MTHLINELIWFLLWVPLILVCVTLIAALFAWAKFSRGARLSVNRPASFAARMSERGALAGLGIALLAMLFEGYRFSDSPFAVDDVIFAALPASFWVMMGTLSVIATVWFFIARFRHSAWAFMAVLVFFACLIEVPYWGQALGRRISGNMVGDESVPVEIKLPNQVEGADVWANDVYLGKTPIHTTVATLRKVPNWANSQDIPVKTKKEKWHKDDRGKGSHAPFVILTVPEPFDTQGRVIYFRAKFGDAKMYKSNGRPGEINLQKSRVDHSGEIQPCRMQLHMFLPRWAKEAEQLLQRARLNDYQIDDAWLNAAESYGDEVWQAMRHASVDEPQFNQTLDDWARRRYKLDGVHGPDSARDVLEHIATEAEEAGYYSSDSPAGRAVELVVPYLDTASVVEQAEQRIEAFRTSGVNPWWDTSQGTRDGRDYFSTDPTQRTMGLPYDPSLSPCDAVLVHAVWKLDELLDGKSDQDNLVEQRIVPALLSLKPNDLYTQIDTIAGVLGGSVYDRFILRHDWREKEPDDFYDGIHAWGIMINRWLYFTASLDSEAGRAFRRDHADEVLKMTERIVRDGHAIDARFSRRLNPIGYLFLDCRDDSYGNSPNIGEPLSHEEAYPGKGNSANLAVRFWPIFDRFVSGNSSEGPEGAQIRWAYLCLAQPYCTPEAFVEVYRRYADCRVIQGNLERSVLMTLEPELRREVVTALIEEADKLVDQQKPDAPNYSIRQANANDFRWVKFLTPTEAAAREMVDWLSEELEDKWQWTQRIEQAERIGKRGLFSIHHLRLLAKANDPKLRLLVLTPIQERPTSERRELLKALLEDEDELVRVKAKRVEHELKTLAEKPLPTRG